jgi:hypothetical protein
VFELQKTLSCLHGCLLNSLNFLRRAGLAPAVVMHRWRTSSRKDVRQYR